MFKSKFMAGLVATLIALIITIGLAIVIVLVIEVESPKNWMTYTAAFIAIAVWTGLYNKLKPKDPEDQGSKDDINDLPPRHS